jgi:hypothetical protein
MAERTSGWRDLLTGQVIECRLGVPLLVANALRGLPLAVLVPNL